jgi:hypothetical protein
MMLKGQPGSIATGAGWLPGAASQILQRLAGGGTV